MANFTAWAGSLSSLGLGTASYSKPLTHETYDGIKGMGLPTVRYAKARIPPAGTQDSLRAVDGLTRRFSSFIAKNAPCLFIWDSPGKRSDKGYFFDLRGFDRIAGWLGNGRPIDTEYVCLVTTQVSPILGGFVGSLFSDGKGRVLCETLHKPGVYRQTDLSQKGERFTEWLTWLATDDHAPSLFKGFPNVHLSPENAGLILDTYSGHKGYFEFVYGNMNGAIGLYTTGYENHELFGYPSQLHDVLSHDLEGRLKAVGLKQNL